MEALLILLGIAIIWIIFYAVNKNRNELEPPEKRAASERSELKITLPGVEKPNYDRTPAKERARAGSDYLYAISHDMWVCRRCESLNDNMTHRCVACGAKRTAERGSDYVL